MPSAYEDHLDKEVELCHNFMNEAVGLLRAAYQREKGVKARIAAFFKKESLRLDNDH